MRWTAFEKTLLGIFGIKEMSVSLIHDPEDPQDRFGKQALYAASRSRCPASGQCLARTRRQCPRIGRHRPPCDGVMPATCCQVLVCRIVRPGMTIALGVDAEPHTPLIPAPHSGAAHLRSEYRHYFCPPALSDG